MTTRKNQKSPAYPWDKVIDAVNQTHGIGVKAPAYRDFVKVHVQAMDSSNAVGMSWGVHTMRMASRMMMEGFNFLREYSPASQPTFTPATGYGCQTILKDTLHGRRQAGE